MATKATTRRAPARRTVTRQPVQSNSGLAFIGCGWTKRQVNGVNAGKDYLVLKLDQGVSLQDDDTIFVFPSVNKRAGRRDPDFRLMAEMAA